MRTSSVFLVCCVAATLSLRAQPPQFTRTDYTSSVGTRGIVAVDVNRDGRLDLVTANSQPDTVTVLRNEGSAGFRAVQEASLIGGGFGMTAADVNGDDLPDVVVADSDADSIAVLRGRADGTLQPGLFIGTVGHPRDVTLADLNGDGWLDLVYSAFYNNAIAVMLANGFGGFDSLTFSTTPVGVRPQGVAAGDFNRDGRADVVVANTGANLLMLMLGDGTGGFTRTDVPGPQNLNEVVAADLDRDGWLDVAAVSTANNTVNVYRGTASGLSLTYTGGTGTSPRGVTAGDLNGDGRLDVVTANRDADSVTVLMGRADPNTLNFDRTDFPAADGSRAVDVGDFDGDGRLDFAAGNQFAGAVSVFRTQTDPPDPGPAEIVLHTHRGVPHGAWRTMVDGSAAGGLSLWHPDAAAPKITAPQANPTNYFEMQFVADPTLSYKLWLRLKAESNHWGNDSVFVQFNAATDASGAPAYGIGTTSGLDINLEECTHCGISGWGWRDDAWGTAGVVSDTVLQFPAGGTQTIRVQTREDGVMVDQIVLSSAVYRTTRPGTTRNDTTILPRSQ